MSGTQRADRIIADAKREYTDYRRSHPYALATLAYDLQVGFLNAEVRKLCDELGPMNFQRNVTLDYIDVQLPGDGCAFVGGFEYARAVPAKMSGPPEDCDESEPESLEMFEVRLSGVDITALLSTAALEDFENATLERIHQQQAEARDNAP